MQVIALFIPIVVYDSIRLMVAFAFQGIENTLLQVAHNPMVSDVVNKEKLTGTLSPLESLLKQSVHSWDLSSQAMQQD